MEPSAKMRRELPFVEANGASAVGGVVIRHKLVGLGALAFVSGKTVHPYKIGEAIAP